MPFDLRIAIIVNPDLPPGLVANTVGAIAIGLGARLPQLGAARLTDAEGNTIDISSNTPLPILAAAPEAIAAILGKVLPMPENCAVVPFPAFARALHDYVDYEAQFPNCRLVDEPIDGLGLAGPGKWVRSLTGSLKLLR
ncbi:MAG: DUF2000 domain-containing protein [Alphaproteobacteria bacterium]|nr:DUF2000 domain-containing protein [Alphaproteobacteria bacterium]